MVEDNFGDVKKGRSGINFYHNQPEEQNSNLGYDEGEDSGRHRADEEMEIEPVLG